MKFAPKNVIAAAVLVVSFVLFAAWAPSIPHAGQSVYILTQKLGVDPVGYFSNPVYGWVLKALELVAGSSVVHAAHLFSALCGAGVLALLFVLVYRAARSYNYEKAFSPPQMHRIQIAAGLVAVLYVLASPPFFMAATRANPLTFDLLLVLTSFYLVVSFTKDVHPARLVLATLLYGITVVEFNTAILLAPIFAILVLHRLWVSGLFSLGWVFRLLLVGLLGLSIYLIQAGLYRASPVYEWRAFSGFGQLLYYIWLEQYQSLTLTLPRVGWLTLGMVSFIPWVLTIWLGFPKGSARTRGAFIGGAILYALLGGLGILLLQDFPLAPLSVTGTTRLFVTPYLWIGLWAGNVAAYLLVALFRPKRFESDAMRLLRKATGIALIGAVPVYLLVMLAVSSMPQARSPVDRLIHDMIGQVIESAEGKSWLVTSTPLDEQLSLALHLRSSPTRLLRIGYARSPVHMQLLASQLEDQPRLQSLARIGMEPLLEEWFMRTPGVEREVAVVHMPDMWLNAGLAALPDRVVFLGVPADVPPDIDAVLEKHRAFWAGFGRELLALRADERHAKDANLRWMALHLSKIANNLGVFLEDAGRSADAMACYRQARELEPDNLSALMNMHVLAQREQLPEYAALEEELVKRTEDMMGRVQPFSLSSAYGFVRVPELFTRRGMAFAMSGKPNMALNEMKKALSLQENNPALQVAVASLYFAQEKDLQSQEYYEDALRNDPGNMRAMRGLLMLAIRKGDLKEGRRWLQQLRDRGVDAKSLRMEEAGLESFAGSPAKALEILNQLVKEDPDNLQAWAAISIAAAQMNDKDLAGQAAEKLQAAKVLTPPIQLVMAQTALDQKDSEGARRHLNEVLRLQPGNIRALEMLLRLELSEGNRDRVQAVTERILSVDSSNALANYMLGVNHYYNEEYALAEASYRASLATYRSPEALNDLAYVLNLQNRLEEAESLIRESLALNNRSSVSWDTLGVVLMKRGNLAEAEEALMKSLAIRPNSAIVTLNLALLHEKQERWEEADRLAKDVSARINDLPSREQTELRELQQRLTDRR